MPVSYFKDKDFKIFVGNFFRGGGVLISVVTLFPGKGVGVGGGEGKCFFYDILTSSLFLGPTMIFDSG